MSVDANAQQFIHSLIQSERNREPSDLIELFADDAILESTADSQSYRGKNGARRFWCEYLASFDRIESLLQNSHEFGDIAVLEWEKHGVLPSGQSIDYCGVSIVEFDKMKIKRFVSYDRPAA